MWEEDYFEIPGVSDVAVSMDKGAYVDIPQ